MDYIDAHSHVWTPDTENYPLAAGTFRDRLHPRSFTAEELMQLAEPVGVNRVVLIQMSFYGYDNSYMLDMIRKDSKRFVGVAVIDQDAKRPDIEMRKLKSQGVRGFRIYPKNQKIQQWLDDPAMHAMWKTGADDYRNRARRADYLDAMHDMFRATDRKEAPWHIVDNNNRKAGRIAALTYVADRLEALVPLDFPDADPAVVKLAQDAFGYRPSDPKK